jgi:hypothetical protein
MLEILLSVLITWMVMGALSTWKEETSNNILWDILDYSISLPWVVLTGIFIIICYPFMLIWKFIRNAVKPVTQEAWDRVKIEKYFKIGNLYICYDRKARAFCNKLFLVRIARPRNAIAHDPVLIVADDEPSTPPGEFR